MEREVLKVSIDEIQQSLDELKTEIEQEGEYDKIVDKELLKRLQTDIQALIDQFKKELEKE